MANLYRKNLAIVRLTFGDAVKIREYIYNPLSGIRIYKDILNLANPEKGTLYLIFATFRLYFLEILTRHVYPKL